MAARANLRETRILFYDYSSRTKGVLESVILRPENSPEWTAKTATLWNAVEFGEKRKDAQLSREFILAVPKELSSKEQLQLAVGWRPLRTTPMCDHLWPFL
jgi:hypothetical protein